MGNVLSPLRVCIDARLESGMSGGVEQFVIGLASGLSRLTDGNEEYLFLSFKGRDQWLRPYLKGPCSSLNITAPAPPPRWRKVIKNVLPVVDKAWKNLSPAAGRLTVKLPSSDGTVEKAGVSIMHFATQSGFLTEVPSIYHPHDLQHLHLPEFFTPRERLKREVLYRQLCERAQMVAVAASWGKVDLIKQYGLLPDKVQVIPLAPALSEYPVPSDNDIRQCSGKFNLLEPFVFYPAQTWAHKNHIRLLEAVEILHKQRGLNVNFVAAGRQNEFFPEIKRRAEELGVSQRVSFLGFVSPMELQSLYRLCRCVVIPTKFEAASIPLWEAFLAGVPAACSNVTSLPAQAGDAALVFDPDRPDEIAEAIWRLWTDEALRAELVERGKKNVARFSWEKTAKQFRAHYRRIAGRPLTDEDQALLSAAPLL